jgi:hypothetical protein
MPGVQSQPIPMKNKNINKSRQISCFKSKLYKVEGQKLLEKRADSKGVYGMNSVSHI